MSNPCPIGILMVDTQFERFIGDIGNPDTWSFPVHYHIVRGATPKHMVNLQIYDVLEEFKIGADQLIAQGVAGITTTCGFLGLYQRELAAHCAVPVATSALLQVPIVGQFLAPKNQVGILTYDAAGLSSELLQALQVAADTPIQGIEKTSLFYRWIMHGLAGVKHEELLPDVLQAARKLIEKYPAIGAIVCECTNLSPFADDIRHETGLPVYDMLTLLHWFHAGISTAENIATR